MSDSHYTVLRNARISLDTPPSTAEFAPGQILGALRFSATTIEAPAELPLLQVGLPLLAGTAADELWQAGSVVENGTASGIHFRRTPDLVFGVLEIAENAQVAQPLKHATETGYQRLFALLAEQGYPQLYRCWNYIAAINDSGDGLERYRQFNLGRQEAFLAWGRSVSGDLPAACALGTRSGPLQIAFLAGKTLAQAIENPRQMSAYAYPEEYGPRSPTFSRATLLRVKDGEILFVSGTASIVGHKTEHAGDVAAQTRQTLINLEALYQEANLHLAGRRFHPAEQHYRVYVRHAADVPAIREAWVKHTGREPDAVFLQADICRADLLLEVETTAYSAAISNAP
jgi:chorismate lyase/3-hydroxybenzoate synthase